MLESFLNELSERAKTLGISPDEFVRTYTRRFNLGLEAGFTEEEIIARFGKVEDILKENSVSIKEQEKDVEFGLDKLEISLADNCDVIIEEGDSIHVDMDEDMLKYYDLIRTENKLVIQGKYEKTKRIRSFDGLTITLPKNLIIKEGSISTINSDINCEVKLAFESLSVNTVSGDLEFDFIKAKDADFSMVSGDLNVDTIASINCTISTVSGDVEFETAAITNLEVSTISGDITIEGDIERVDSSSISGEISINHKSQKTSLKDALGSMFRF